MAFLLWVIISTFAIILVGRMIVTHARLGDFIHTANVSIIGHSQKACAPLQNPLWIPHTNLLICADRHVHTFQMVGTSTVQLAQTGKVRFTQHSTILLAALWLVKVSRTFYAVVLLLVNPLTLWSFHYNIELNQAQQKCTWRIDVMSGYDPLILLHVFLFWWKSWELINMLSGKSTEKTILSS